MEIFLIESFYSLFYNHNMIKTILEEFKIAIITQSLVSQQFFKITGMR